MRRVVNAAERDQLVANLMFVYQVMRASTNLLRVAISLLGEGRLRTYYEKHLREEENHAEWLLEDLDGQKEYSPLAAAIAGTAYYLVYHEHPAALLGYMLAMETSTIDEKLLCKLEAIHGEKLLRTVRIHVVEDTAHRKEILDEIAACKEHAELITMSTNTTLQYLSTY